MKQAASIVTMCVVCLLGVAACAQDEGDFSGSVEAAIKNQAKEREFLRLRVKMDYAKKSADVLPDVMRCLEKGVFEPKVTSLSDLEDVFDRENIIEHNDSTICIPLRKLDLVKPRDREGYSFPELSASSRNWFLLCKFDKGSKSVVHFSLWFGVMSELGKQ